MRKAGGYGEDSWLKPCSKIFQNKAEIFKLSDFQMTAKLGQGGYAKVVKVKAKDTGDEFAMKIVSKQLIQNLKMIDQLRNEIQIMDMLKHDSIINQLTYFEDHRNIYFILELAEDKHLYQKLKSKGKYSESEAALIIHDILKAVDYLHTREPPIIHRDIKPENILFVKSKAKLADFGWSNLKDRVRTTYCGTPDYLAPEMVNEIGHNEKLDIWTIGVQLFELVNGTAPFTPPSNVRDKHQAQKILDQNILGKDPKFVVDKLSKEYKDLVGLMLRKNYRERPSAGMLIGNDWFKIYLPEAFRVPVLQKGLPPKPMNKNMTPINADNGRNPEPQMMEMARRKKSIEEKPESSCNLGPKVGTSDSTKLVQKKLSDSLVESNVEEVFGVNNKIYFEKGKEASKVISFTSENDQKLVPIAEKKDNYSMEAVKKLETDEYREKMLKKKIKELKIEIKDFKMAQESKDVGIQEQSQKLRILDSKILKDENHKEVSLERLQDLLSKEKDLVVAKEELKIFESKNQQYNNLILLKDEWHRKFQEKDLEASRLETKLKSYECSLIKTEKIIEDYKNDINLHKKEVDYYENRIAEQKHMVDLKDSGDTYGTSMAVLEETAILLKKKVTHVEAMVSDHQKNEANIEGLSAMLMDVIILFD